MKVVILAGGLGTRISEETSVLPKPMVSIGGKPIIMHIIDYFIKYGINEFIICAGYKSEIIKQYFINYNVNNSDILINTKDNSVSFNKENISDFKVSIIDTGINAQTGYRLRSIEKYVDDDFILTYGDGLSDININSLIKEHKTNSNLATITAVQIKNKFGLLDIDENNLITSFKEKSFDQNNGWINGGFMVLKKDVFHYLTNDINESLEFDVLPKIANDKKLGAYKHRGFWKCMDTLKDKNEFEQMILEKKTLWIK